jgi:hypothetical protein
MYMSLFLRINMCLPRTLKLARMGYERHRVYVIRRLFGLRLREAVNGSVTLTTRRDILNLKGGGVVGVI